jgi:PEP-CTERM motif-containing protein
MKRTLFVMALVLGLATAAGAATLSVTSNAPTYNVGDTITLTVSGDGAGATSYSLIGRLLYNAALADPGVSSQNAVGAGWILGVLSQSDGSADSFNQIAFPAATASNLPGGNPFATLTLIAQAPGTVNVDWDSNFSWFALQGAGAAPGTSFTINAVPEPTTAAMLALGLFGLALGGRRSP